MLLLLYGLLLNLRDRGLLWYLRRLLLLGRLRSGYMLLLMRLRMLLGMLSVLLSVLLLNVLLSVLLSVLLGVLLGVLLSMLLGMLLGMLLLVLSGMLRGMWLSMLDGVLRCVLGMGRRVRAGRRTLPLSRGWSWRRSRGLLLRLRRLRLRRMSHALLDGRRGMMLLMLSVLLMLLLEGLLWGVSIVNRLGLVAPSQVGLLLIWAMASAVPSRVVVVSIRVLLRRLLHLLLVLQRRH